MGWSPTPASPKHVWQGYEICLNIYNDGMGDAIVALYRPANSVEWLSMGNADGQVWWGDFIQETQTMGFKTWLTRIIELIKAKLDAWCKTIFPEVPSAEPANFVEFQAWASTHTKWIDSPKNITVDIS